MEATVGGSALSGDYLLNNGDRGFGRLAEIGYKRLFSEHRAYSAISIGFTATKWQLFKLDFLQLFLLLAN